MGDGLIDELAQRSLVQLDIVKIFHHAGAGFLPDHTEAEALTLQNIKIRFAYFVAERLNVRGLAAEERENLILKMRMFLYYDRVAFLRPGNNVGGGLILNSMVRKNGREVTDENRTLFTYVENTLQRLQKCCVRGQTLLILFIRITETTEIVLHYVWFYMLIITS